MAAATAVFRCLLPGDHVLVSRVLYWGMRTWLAEFVLPWGLDVEFTDPTDPGALASAIRPGRTRLLWLETPANPTWEITDLAAACQLAHSAGARVAVDNTVPTPVLTRPFEHGADLVVHSASKYLNGHSDVLAGAVLSARPGHRHPLPRSPGDHHRALPRAALASGSRDRGAADGRGREPDRAPGRYRRPILPGAR
jgi:cystathionine gamma-synthase